MAGGLEKGVLSEENWGKTGTGMGAGYRGEDKEP
jgi:hypothetical protein